MKFWESDSGDTKVLHLSGKILGGVETETMCDKLKKALKSGIRQLVLDFRNVRWMNSTGIGAVIGCMTAVRSKGGDIRFANVQGATRHYFHITKLDTVVGIYDSVEAAVASFGEE